MLNNRKVIVTYRNFRDVSREEILPEVFRVEEGETSVEALRRIYDAHYEGMVEEGKWDSDNGPDKKKCWCRENEGLALLTWRNGDTKEFYIIEVESF